MKKERFPRDPITEQRALTERHELHGRRIRRGAAYVAGVVAISSAVTFGLSGHNHEKNEKPHEASTPKPVTMTLDQELAQAYLPGKITTAEDAGKMQGRKDYKVVDVHVAGGGKNPVAQRAIGPQFNYGYGNRPEAARQQVTYADGYVNPTPRFLDPMTDGVMRIPVNLSMLRQHGGEEKIDIYEAAYATLPDLQKVTERYLGSVEVSVHDKQLVPQVNQDPSIPEVNAMMVGTRE